MYNGKIRPQFNVIACEWRALLMFLNTTLQMTNLYDCYNIHSILQVQPNSVNSSGYNHLLYGILPFDTKSNPPLINPSVSA